MKDVTISSVLENSGEADETESVKDEESRSDESEAGEAYDDIASDDEKKRKTVESSGEHTTKFGRVVRAPVKLSYGHDGQVDLTSSAVELRYLGSMAELDNYEVSVTQVTPQEIEMALVGAGVGGGFKNVSELKVLNFKQAMKSPDRDLYLANVKKEKERFDKYEVFTPVPRDEIPKGAKVLTST